MSPKADKGQSRREAVMWLPGGEARLAAAIGPGQAGSSARQATPFLIGYAHGCGLPTASIKPG